MPHQHPLPAAACEDLSPPPENPVEVLENSVSATSVSFVICGAAVSDLGELLQNLRLALQVPGPRPASVNEIRAAALLAARLETVRGALDGATAAIDALLEDCVPAGAAPRSRRSRTDAVQDGRRPPVGVTGAPANPSYRSLQR